MKQDTDSTARTTAAHITEDLHGGGGKIRRILFVTGLAIINAILVGIIAKLLVMLISFFTGVFFYGEITFEEISPAENALGYWVILVPVAGGLIVGLMARFGSRAIRGHGIPEAMEKIITDESKIPPLITILKPLSSAISIGSGGPFGAEGPIISTGGALGSFCGQTLHITAQERKVLLAACATAGMTAIFGTPFAAILLAIELLLFEFSARSFLPVMMACITGACMHFVLFSSGPTFPMPEIPTSDSLAVAAYAAMGLVIGLASVLVTKAVYYVEDAFEKLPIHWMWWPALGGIGVGVIGLIAPKTLGVGYNNITEALSGSLPVTVLVTLCFWKFLSWAIALGSGTSGGTLAPLLTIGSAIGCLLGLLVQTYLPQANISLPLAALVGMAALFAGSSRALLTSIAFALETTMQESTLLPLIAGCSTAYLVSFIMMRSTIMTEKIKRRGILMPESYRPDVLELKKVSDIMSSTQSSIFFVDDSLTIKDVRELALTNDLRYSNMPIVVRKGLSLRGFVDRKLLFESEENAVAPITVIIRKKCYSVYSDNSLDLALEFMLKTKQQVLPVSDRATHEVVGTISERDVLKVFEQRFIEDKRIHQHISIKKKAARALGKMKVVK